MTDNVKNKSSKKTSKKEKISPKPRKQLHSSASFFLPTMTKLLEVVTEFQESSHAFLKRLFPKSLDPEGLDQRKSEYNIFATLLQRTTQCVCQIERIEEMAKVMKGLYLLIIVDTLEQFAAKELHVPAKKYAPLLFFDSNGKRAGWVCDFLPHTGTKTEATRKLTDLLSNFDIPEKCFTLFSVRLYKPSELEDHEKVYIYYHDDLVDEEETVRFERCLEESFEEDGEGYIVVIFPHYQEAIPGDLYINTALGEWREVSLSTLNFSYGNDPNPTQVKH